MSFPAMHIEHFSNVTRVCFKGQKYWQEESNGVRPLTSLSAQERGES